jgi:hypothetical protein
MDSYARNRQQWSDAMLLSAIASRDGAAFAVFYRRHPPAVLAFLMFAAVPRWRTTDGRDWTALGAGPIEP